MVDWLIDRLFYGALVRLIDWLINSHIVLSMAALRKYFSSSFFRRLVQPLLPCRTNWAGSRSTWPSISNNATLWTTCWISPTRRSSSNPTSMSPWRGPTRPRSTWTASRWTGKVSFISPWKRATFGWWSRLWPGKSRPSTIRATAAISVHCSSTRPASTGRPRCTRRWSWKINPSYGCWWTTGPTWTSPWTWPTPWSGAVHWPRRSGMVTWRWWICCWRTRPPTRDTTPWTRPLWVRLVWKCEQRFWHYMPIEVRRFFWLVVGQFHLSIDWLIDWSIDSFFDWLIDWLIDWPIDLLIDWLIDCLICCWFAWLIDWLIVVYCIFFQSTLFSWFVFVKTVILYCDFFWHRHGIQNQQESDGTRDGTRHSSSQFDVWVTDLRQHLPHRPRGHQLAGLERPDHFRRILASSFRFNPQSQSGRRDGAVRHHEAGRLRRESGGNSRLCVPPAEFAFSERQPE